MAVDVQRTSADYAQQLTALLPPGPAWDAQLQPQLHALLAAMAQELGRIDARSQALMQEAFLGTFHESLQDWEATLDLPDECLPGGGTVAERKAMVRMRLVEGGGQTPAFYVELAARLGYRNARVQELRAPRFGCARFGRDHFGTWDAQFMWILHAGGRLTGGSRFGLTVWGERFGSNPSNALVCVVRRAAPAHTLEFVNFD
jgi:uncharacterized protein YmfQ (DUF2313 family)